MAFKNHHLRAIRVQLIVVFILANSFILADCVWAEATNKVQAVTNVNILSDYRFRGVSFTDRGPAAQAGLDIGYQSGLFGGYWISNLANYGGSDLEVDLYSGARTVIGSIQYSAAVYGYVYPGGQNVDTFEFQGVSTYNAKAFSSEFLIAIAPKQSNSNKNNLYLSNASLIEIVGSKLLARVHFGIEQGLYDMKCDWSVGLVYRFYRSTLSVAYVDSNYSDRLGNNAAAAALIGVGSEF